MFEGIKPLDLSFLQNRPLDATKLAGGFANVPSLQNIANTISAGTDWSKVPEAKKSKGPHDKPTFWSGLMDVLSAGNYAVANAVHEGIQASDRGDNPLEIVGNALKGAGWGIGAGVGGGIGTMLGIDSIAQRKDGKTRWSDVYNELGIFPQPLHDPTSNKFYIKNSDGSLKEISSGEAKADQIKNLIGGLGTDIVTDPLTYFGLGDLPKANNIIKAVPKVADALGEMKGFKKLDAPVASELNASKGDIPSTPVAENKFQPVMQMNNSLDGLVTSSPKGLGKVPPVAESTSAVPPRADLTVPQAIAETPIAEKLLARSLSNPKNQQLLASKIAGLIQAAPDSKTAIKQVSDWLRSKHSGFQFPSIENYLEKIRTADPRFFQLIKHPTLPKAAELRKNVVAGMLEAVKTDVASANRTAKNAAHIAPETTDARQIINDMAAGNINAAKPVGEVLQGTNNLGKSETAILGDLVKKYQTNISTGLFDTAKNPLKLLTDIHQGKNVKWTGPAQVNVWNSILKRLVDTGQVKYAFKGRYTKALQMLKAFEDHFISQGHTPYSAYKATEAIPLRLSDVIEHVGIDNFVKHGDVATTILRSAFSGGPINPAVARVIKNNPEIAASINNALEYAKARSAVAESPAIESGMTAGKNLVENMIGDNALSAAKQSQIVDSASKAAKTIAQTSGASPAGANLAQSWVKDTFKSSDPIGSAIASSRMNTLVNLTGVTDKASFPYKFSNAPKITRAIEQQLGPISAVANKWGPAAKVEEWLGARFNAAYRNADMRPIYLANMASAKATVSLRAAEVNELVRKFGKDGNLWHEAWDVARGVKPAASSEIGELASELQRVMENLFSGSGLRAGAEYENSVSVRGQLLRKELNKAFGRYGVPYELSNSKMANKDYSQGIDWLKSWEEWEAKNPLQLIYNIQNAVEHTVRTRATFDEIISRFGSTAGNASNTTRLPKSVIDKYPYFSGIYFTPEHAKQAEYFLKAFEEVGKPSSNLLRQYDNILSKWKGSVTIYRPAHYWRNLMGDMTFNWLAGVNGAKPYTTAMKVMKSQKGKYQWETLSDLTGPEALKKALSGALGPEGNNVAFTMKNGKKVTNDMVYISAFQEGLLPSARVLEDLPDAVPSILDRIHLPGKLEGKGQELAHSVHEQRDHFIRLAHYIDSLQKSSKSFENAVKDAAHDVRKWHPDGMDLTAFEKNYMRRVFPFYSWTRKALPLMVESVVSSPAKVMLYPKLQYGLQGLFMTPGETGDSWGDPFPVDQLWPDWMREKGIGPIAGSPGDFTFINPSNPLQDLAAQFGDIPQMAGQGFSPEGIGGVSSMLTPLIKIPAELTTGTQVQTGAPVTDWTQYATGQIPGVSDLSRATNVDLGGTSPKFSDQGFGNVQNIINYLTAMGYTKTTPKTGVTGQFDLRDYLKKQAGG